MALRDGGYGLGYGRAVVPRPATPSAANSVRPFRPRGMEAEPIARPKLPPMPPNPLPMVVDRLQSAGAALLRLVRDFFAQFWGGANTKASKTRVIAGTVWESATNKSIFWRWRYTVTRGKSTYNCAPGSATFENTGGTATGYGGRTAGRLVIPDSSFTTIGVCGGAVSGAPANIAIVTYPAGSSTDNGNEGIASGWNGTQDGYQTLIPASHSLIITSFTVDGVAVELPHDYDTLNFIPRPIEPAEAEPEPARQPVRRPMLPPLPLPARPPGAPSRPLTAPPSTTPSQPRPLAPPAPRPNQPAPTQPSPTPQAPPADAEVLRIEEIIRRVAPPITTTATPVAPAGPQTQTVANNGTVLEQAPAPTPQTPTDARQYGTTTITSGSPRVDPSAVAEELGRVEQKLGRLVGAMDRTPDWLDSLLTSLLQQLIPALLDALKVDVPADTWEFSAPCDRDEDGEPITHTVELPGEDFPEATITRLNEIAQVLQVLKDWRQPLCRGQNVLSNVTVTALEIEPEA